MFYFFSQGYHFDLFESYWKVSTHISVIRFSKALTFCHIRLLYLSFYLLIYPFIIHLLPSWIIWITCWYHDTLPQILQCMAPRNKDIPPPQPQPQTSPPKFVCVCGTRIWTQGLTLARQAFYYLSHSTGPGLCVYVCVCVLNIFKIGSRELFALGCLWTSSSWSLPPK
jgi:hypothetical protein